jgi:hypothetical protein
MTEKIAAVGATRPQARRLPAFTDDCPSERAWEMLQSDLQPQAHQIMVKID